MVNKKRTLAICSIGFFAQLASPVLHAEPRALPDEATVPTNTNTATLPALQVETQAGARPATGAAVQTLQEEHAIYKRRLVVDVGLSQAYTDRAYMTLNGFLVLDSIFLGQINIDTVKSEVATFNIDTRMGVSDRLQVDLDIPFVYRRSTYQSGGAEAAAPKISEKTVTKNWQLGDVSAGLSYQLLAESTTSPDVVGTLRLKAPSGSSPYGIKLHQPVTDNSNLNIPKRLPSGNGVWSISSGLSFLRTADPAVLFTNLNYIYNFEQKVDDISVIEGTTVPGRVRLGNSYQFGAGIAFALNERLSVNGSYALRVNERTEIKADGGKWAGIVGSDGNTSTFNMGLTYNTSPTVSVVANLGIGLTADAPDVQFSVKLPFSS